MKRSAGIVPYKIIDGRLFVFLAHPGGPFWAGSDAWSICKGEYVLSKESALHAALREFREETGHEIKNSRLLFLGSSKQKSKKLITIFAVNEDVDATDIKSNTFFREYPKGSGIRCEFPEMDQANWFLLEEAMSKVFFGQKLILRKLNEMYKNNLL